MKTLPFLVLLLLGPALPLEGQTIGVPENRTVGSTRTIQIRYAIVPATAKATRPPVFYFTGGPGQSAVAETASVAKRFGALRSDRDLVFIDLRGMGESNGLDCAFGTLDDVIRAWHAAVISREVVEACAAELGRRADLAAYNTTEAVKDVEAVRAALGYDSIAIMGVSYGTRAALEYLRRYPDRVSAIVLSSVLPPTHSARGEQAANAAASLEHVLQECERDAKCSQEFPHVRAELDSVRVRLDRAPLQQVLEGTWASWGKEITITRDVFEGALVRMLYTWGWARAIPAGIHDLYQHGQQGPLAIAMLARQMDQGLAVGAWLSYSCAEDIEMARTDLSKFRAICSAWPHARLSADFRAPIRSKVPALIISGADDPATPPAWGEKVRGWMRNSAHMVVSGWSHNPTPQCATTAIIRLLQNGSSSGLETECAGKTSRLPFESALPKL